MISRYQFSSPLFWINKKHPELPIQSLKKEKPHHMGKHVSRINLYVNFPRQRQTHITAKMLSDWEPSEPAGKEEGRILSAGRKSRNIRHHQHGWELSTISWLILRMFYNDLCKSVVYIYNYIYLYFYLFIYLYFYLFFIYVFLH